MQKILKITAIVLLFTLCSCEKLVPKEYVLHARNSKQESELNELLAKKGIYKLQLDYAFLSFKYSNRQNDLVELEKFFAANDLINTDTTQEMDSTYIFVEELERQEAELDSLRKVDSIIQGAQNILEVFQVDSILAPQEIIEVVEDSITH